MIKKYEMLSDSKLEPLATRGTTVYSCMSHDYGCANDDTRMTGIEHTSVTLKSDGGYPFFTVPKSGIKEIK
jgi:hypothetical protein